MKRSKPIKKKDVNKQGASLMEKHPQWAEFEDRLNEKSEERRRLERRFEHFLAHPDVIKTDLELIL